MNFPAETLRFLRALKRNNRREWFNGHRDDYEAYVRQPMTAIVERLAERSIHARDGNMYAPRLIEAAGFDTEPGVTRVSLCHYNSLAEIARFGEALRTLAA